MGKRPTGRCHPSGLPAWLLVVSLIAGCGKVDLARNGNGSADDTNEDYQSLAELELAELIEEGLADQVPAPLSEEQLDLHAVESHRRDVAGRMRTEVAASMTPLILATSLFAIEGPADVVLAILPVRKFRQAINLGWDMLRKGKKVRAEELIQNRKQFLDLLDDDAREFVRVAGRVSTAERRPFKIIGEYSKSTRTHRVLIQRHVLGDANPAWIAKKLQSGKLDGDFVRRFTFDGDFVEEFTLYDAHPSWKTLENVVKRRPVDPKHRAWLARQVRGLAGERAAADIIRTHPDKYLKRRAGWFDIGRGVGYGPNGRSFDIVAYGDEGEAVFVEVKTWSAETWSLASQRKKTLTQLERHNEGVDILVAKTLPRRRATDRILMVEQSGFEGLEGAERREFRDAAAKLGWRIELIPARRVGTFKNLIDDIR